MKKILIPTDFSAAAMNAAEFTISLFGDRVEAYALAHSYQTPQAGASMLVSINDLLKEEAEKEMKEMVSALKEKFPVVADKIESFVHYGDVSGVVSRALRSDQYALVAMGTTGASGIQDKLMGTNAANIIKKSKVPVLALPENVRFKGVKKVTLAVDAAGVEGTSDVSRLKELLEMTGATLEVVHVTQQKAAADSTSKNLNGLNGIQYVYQALVGADVEKEIDKELHRSHSDLLVMVSRKQGFFQKLFHKSMSKRMAMHTDIPLLALHGM